MNDDFESSLRASLQTLAVAHDDARADEMIAVAAAGRPLAGRRAMLAPLATAAAVAAVGVTVAVAASGGHDSDRADTAPAASPPPSGGAAVTITYDLASPVTGQSYGKPTAPRSADLGDLDGGTPGNYYRLSHWASVDRVTIANPQGDRATVRLDWGGKTNFDFDLAGQRSSTTSLNFQPTDGSAQAALQCREPGGGERCHVTVTVSGTLSPTPVSPLAPSTEVPASPGSPVRPSASCPGCEIP